MKQAAECLGRWLPILEGGEGYSDEIIASMNESLRSMDDGLPDTSEFLTSVIIDVIDRVFEFEHKEVRNE
ncbi:hypothetical protein [Candidatus Electronema sp. JM]|uniref:hypothetical protein n=1 Tax=Candidatus Electronema sp. JM TaxID=3401571 RepID=UPI003AA9DB4C